MTNNNIAQMLNCASSMVHDQQQLAIQAHSDKAQWFADEYRSSDDNPYCDCFAYSRKRLDAILAQLVPEPHAGAQLLDVGCGTGHYMRRYAAAGYSVAGVDGSAAMLLQARKQNPTAELRECTLESLPFGTSTFDLVLCIEVLRYLSNTDRCIAEMSRVTRPGGTCIATAQPYLNANGYWLVNRLARRLHPKHLSSLRQSFVWPWRLASAFRSAGFTTAAVVSVYTGPVNWWERLARPHIGRLLRWWEPIDAVLCRRRVLTPFANMIVIRATK